VNDCIKKAGIAKIADWGLEMGENGEKGVEIAEIGQKMA